MADEKGDLDGLISAFLAARTGSTASSGLNPELKRTEGALHDYLGAIIAEHGGGSLEAENVRRRVNFAIHIK